jgi:hypothetical protein
MLHIICATLVFAAAVAETTMIRHWMQQHALVQQAVAVAAYQAQDQIRN